MAVINCYLFFMQGGLKMNEVTMNEVKEMIEKKEENQVITVWIGGNEK